MVTVVAVGLVIAAVAWLWSLWRWERSRANRLQARSNEQHEQLGRQSELWNLDRDKLRKIRGLVLETLPPEDLDRIRQTEYGRQVLGG